jgi:hypothetical protein
MRNAPFIKNWNHVVNHDLLKSIQIHFEDINCPTVGELNFSQYSKGIIIENEICENGLYIFKFQDTFYVGKATSCTLLERLAKHFDSRKAGGFNSLLKKLKDIDATANAYPENQKILSEAKLLLIPIEINLLINNNPFCNKTRCVDDLEMDLIIQLRSVFNCNERNLQKKIKLSGGYFKD